MPRRSQRRSNYERLRVILYSVAMGIILGATYARVNQPEETRLTSTAPRTDWAKQLPASIEAISSALRRLPIPMPTPQEQPRGTGAVHWMQRHYDVSMSAPEDPDTVRTWFNTVEQAAPAVGARIVEDANGVEVQIGVDGLLTHTLSLHWLGHSPRAAIVLADFGDDLLIAREAISLGVQVTFAIDPLRPFAREVAELAQLSHHEALVTMPSAHDPDDLTRTPSATAWLHTLEESLPAVPHAVGLYIDSPQGFGLDPGSLRQFLTQAQDRNLFSLDGATEPGNRLCDGIAAASSFCFRRDVRLDPAADPEAVRLLLESAITLVRTRGDVIVVGTARPAVIAALRQAAPAFAAAQVELTPLSVVVADRRSLSAH